MNPTILKLLFLLSVSCLIGIFFTYRYWKSKIKSIINERDDIFSQLKNQKTDIDRAEENARRLKKQVQELNQELDSLQDKDGVETSKYDEQVQLNVDLQDKLTASSEKIEKLKKKLSNLKKRSDKDKEKLTGLKGLEEALEIKEEELAEKEREIEVLFQELKRGKITYYKQIDGKRYKAMTLKMADESISGKGDGRISMEDAEKIFGTISDGKAYTQVEKDTLRYIRTNYNWTEGADELFRKKVRSWAAKGHVLEGVI